MAAGRKNKKKKIAEINTLPNIFQAFEFGATQLHAASGEAVNFTNQWAAKVFQNNNPVTVELACGKGDYTVALAAEHPERNFIGVDIKGPRLHTGAKYALEHHLKNVAFARFKIENILRFFGEGELQEIWITFPDPFPKDRHEKHRLTHASFLVKYQLLLAKGGVLNFKTDDLDLFRYSVDSISNFGGKLLYCREDIYAQPLDFPELAIKTFYEKQHLAKGRTINFLQAQL